MNFRKLYETFMQENNFTIPETLTRGAEKKTTLTSHRPKMVSPFAAQKRKTNRKISKTSRRRNR